MRSNSFAPLPKAESRINRQSRAQIVGGGAYDHRVVLAVKTVVLASNRADESFLAAKIVGNHRVSSCYHSIQNCLGVTQDEKVNLYY